ncbi:MAG: DinB family protein [Longimicrobiales bacterium]|nr:DinB family protein [Longimicrobiales bacterium]
MIPKQAGDLDDLLAEIDRQHHEVEDLFAAVSRETAVWRPDPTRWSMTGHLEHLSIVNEAYVGAMEAAVERARDRGGAISEGPYRHPWISRRFVRMMEPPPRRRVRTFRAMRPEADLDPVAAVRRFQECHRRLEGLVEAARGLDLGKVRFGSPFFGLLRLSLGAGMELVLAHNRRHLWLIRELMSGTGFPEADAA